MTEVRFLPPAARFIKKLKDKRLKRLFQEAIGKIRVDYTIGEAIFIIIRPIMNSHTWWNI